MTTLNLHGIVRPAITSVNSDVPVFYIASTGNKVLPGGKVVPQFAEPVLIQAQVQPLDTGEMKHYDFLQANSLHRQVYVYGEQNAIDRISKLGGDILQFPELPGGTPRSWLIKAVPEQWPGWCRVIVVAQLDPKNPTT